MATATLRKTSKLVTCEKHADYYAAFPGRRKWEAVCEGGTGSDPCENGECMLTPGTDHYSADFVVSGPRAVAEINGHSSAAEDVLEAAADVVSLTLVRPSDVADSAAAEATRIDREIRDGFRVVLASKATLVSMIADAKARQIHKMLTDPTTGKAYKSWTAYIANVYASLELPAMSKRDRDFLIVLLYNTGLSVQQVATVMAVGFGTAHRAIAAGKADGTVDTDQETEDAQGRKTTRNGETTEKAPKSDAQKVLDRLASLQKFVASAEFTPEDVAAIKKALSAVGKAVAGR